MVQPTKEEAEQYLRNRHRKGFNSIIVNLIETCLLRQPTVQSLRRATLHGQVSRE